MRQRSSGCRSTGSSDASWPQYSNSRRGRAVGEPVEELAAVGPEAAERRQVVGPLEHVDRVDLQQPDVLDHPAQVPAAGLGVGPRLGEALRGEGQPPGFGG